jgi:plasmid stabilization system protein ParE
MKVWITTPARVDIGRVFDFIRQQAGHHKAREIIVELRERCAGLDKMPERYPVVPGFEAAMVRRRVYRDYLIVYRVRPQSVEILRIFHGASDYLRLLAQDQRLKEG